MRSYTIDELSRFIDHTNLKMNVTKKEIETLCNEAKKYHFKMVAVNQVQSQLCIELLENSDINVGAAISFPLGQTTIRSKLFEIENAINLGVNEIDYVINLTEVKAKNWDYVRDEMTNIVTICKENNVISKVIFENSYLSKDEKIELCKIAQKIRPDFIKTSTGFAPTGATYEDVELMKKIVGNEVKVKAAGGIRNMDVFKKMIECGAERIGTSSGVTIISELKKEMDKNDTDVIII